VVSVEISVADILYAIYEAKKFKDKIGMVVAVRPAKVVKTSKVIKSLNIHSPLFILLDYMHPQREYEGIKTIEMRLFKCYNAFQRTLR
jgi:hypothetical protein